MKIRILQTAIFFLLFLHSFSQAPKKEEAAVPNDRATENLFLLGRVWGFLKYHHPQVAKGSVKWDEELLRLIPVFKKIQSKKEVSDSLSALIDRLGEVPVCKTCTDSILKKARLKPDFSWINTLNFSKALVDKLNFIQKNRQTGDNYYVQFYSEQDYYVPGMQHENMNYKIVYPDSTYSLLALFRFWNYIEYWYPYKYNLSESWDNSLKRFIPRMQLAATVKDYYRNIQALTALLKDSHGTISGMRKTEVEGAYHLPFTIRYVQGKFIVTSILNDSLAKIAGINKADIIEAIDGRTVAQIAEDWLPYLPASNKGAFYYKLSYAAIMQKQPESQISILRGYQKMNLTCHNITLNRLKPLDFNPAFFSFPKDSSFCLLKNNIAYLNMYNIDRKDSAAFIDLMKKSKALIIDNRQNLEEGKGTNAFDIIAKTMMGSKDNFFRFGSLTPEYPGVSYLVKPQNFGITDSGYKYLKPIIVLVNEGTISVGEFITMACQKAKKAKIMGTVTAGADGSAVAITLPGYLYVTLTALGVYYPDGRETQRKGIIPDIIVKQTIKGYTENKDEQLEAAIKYLEKNLR